MKREVAPRSGGFFSGTVTSLVERCRALSLPRPDGYDIRPARTRPQQEAANRLVRRMYAWRGYSVQPSAHPPDDPSHTTLVVWQGGKAIATLTLGCDSPGGLLADGLYAQELAGLRREGHVLCEVTRLAVHPESSSGRMLDALFHAALVFGREHYHASDAVIEVNPRHARFYAYRFGFRQVGALRLCPRVNAPAVLLHQALGRLTVFGPGAEGAQCPQEEAWVGAGELAAVG